MERMQDDQRIAHCASATLCHLRFTNSKRVYRMRLPKKSCRVSVAVPVGGSEENEGNSGNTVGLKQYRSGNLERKDHGIGDFLGL